MTVPKDPRLADLLGDRHFIVDHSRMIGDFMGGREYFAYIDATLIHRIGLRAGLGWKIPPAKGGIDLVRVTAQGNPDTVDLYTLQFLKTVEGNIDYAHEVSIVKNVEVQDIKRVFERETINEVSP